MKKALSIFVLVLCCSSYSQVDPNASKKAQDLYNLLYNTSATYGDSQKVLIGQQGAFVQGQGWQDTNYKHSKGLKSDMKTYAKVHPYVFGLDFQEIRKYNDKVILKKIQQHYQKGGVLSLSWHMDGFVKDGKDFNGHHDGSAFDTTSKVVHTILPGGKNHTKFKQALNRLIDFNKKLKGIPVIFRPFHEHNANWFWWGNKNCTKEEFISLWRFTVDYLKSKKVNNFLYAYSPDGNRLGYMTRYPGDQYVDIMGIDKYFSLEYEKMKFSPIRASLSLWKKQIKDLAKRAQKHNKIAAITEFGLKSMAVKDEYFQEFWTKYTSDPLRINKKDLRGISYILIWRNDEKDSSHFFGPTKDHFLNEDFQKMRNQGILKGLGELDLSANAAAVTTNQIKQKPKNKKSFISKVKEAMTSGGNKVSNFFKAAKEKSGPFFTNLGKKSKSSFLKIKNWFSAKFKKAKKVIAKSQKVTQIAQKEAITVTDSKAHNSPKKKMSDVSTPKVVSQVVEHRNQEAYTRGCNTNLIRDDLDTLLKKNVLTGSNSKGFHKLRSHVRLIEDGETFEVLNIAGSDRKRVASTQKIVTAYLLYKNRHLFNFPIQMSSKSKTIGDSGENKTNWSRIKNSNLSESDLLKAILVDSSNGASYRAMEIITGSQSESIHAKMINGLIDEIIPGNSTNFSNAHGLDYYGRKLHIHNSTPEDMAQIAAYIYTDTDYRSYLTKYYSSSSFLSKGGITSRAGKNNVLFLEKKNGECRGKYFSLFYSGLEVKNATIAIGKYFGYNFR